MLSDQIITRKPPASYNKQYIRNVFFLFLGGGGGGGADVKTSCQAALFLFGSIHDTNRYRASHLFLFTSSCQVINFFIRNTC